jgi:hypothetical protein
MQQRSVCTSSSLNPSIFIALLCESFRYETQLNQSTGGKAYEDWRISRRIIMLVWAFYPQSTDSCPADMSWTMERQLPCV